MMSLRQQFQDRFFCAAVLLLITHCQLWGAPMVKYTETEKTGGLFGYNLVLATGPNFYAEGLVVVNGFSVFKLDASSDISAPTVDSNAWGFLAPLPPFADNLSYFSPAVAGDIQPNKEQGDFSFKSITDLKGATFATVVIGYTDPNNIQLMNIAVNAATVPEPHNFVLFSLGMISLGCLKVAVGVKKSG
jgi:hypothetical protein